MEESFPLTYQPPKEWLSGLKVKTIYPPLPGKTDGVDFDIYDFEMLFNDKPTNDLIRSGKTIGCF